MTRDQLNLQVAKRLFMTEGQCHLVPVSRGARTAPDVDFYYIDQSMHSQFLCGLPLTRAYKIIAANDRIIEAVQQEGFCPGCTAQFIAMKLAVGQQ